MTLLTATALAVGFASRIVASGIDVSLAAGTVTCLLGPNGVGKTTLFKTLLGLIPTISGTIELGGTDLTSLSRAAIARRIAYVPQAYQSDFAYTVLDLVVMGRTAYVGNFSTPKQGDVDIAMAALRSLGIEALAERDASRISGGQRQLALIARALAQQTDIVVMDEPTASLDLGNRVLVLDKIRGMADTGLAVLVSTHEPEQAFAIADRVAIFGAHNHFFETGDVATILTASQLTRLYGLDLTVEKTPSGRNIVSPAAWLQRG